MNADLDKMIDTLCLRTMRSNSLVASDLITPEEEFLSVYEDIKQKYEELYAEESSPYELRILNIKDLLQLTGEASFVNLAYKRILGRKADESGQRAWVDALVSGRYTRTQALLEMAFSPEGEARKVRLTGFDSLPLAEFDRYTGRDFIAYSYILMLGRLVDEEGMEQYISQLRGNLITKEEFLHALQTSPEGAGFAPDVPGLEEAYQKRIRRKKLLSIPFFGRAARFVLNLMRINRRVNTLEARNYSIQDSLEWEIGELRRELAACQNRLRETEGQLQAVLYRVSLLEDHSQIQSDTKGRVGK